ncbi:uncharacterized protein LOC116618902 [Nematostella vectensis]|uniref:uncharacterized protein LOC116618902 n=1 Tax=Nematostella vectensis TaxID=45351 RepID=UPI0020777F8D|nr:uncharacterized protein LOC116618902 [Nematostella vectensis]
MIVQFLQMGDFKVSFGLAWLIIALFWSSASLSNAQWLHEITVNNKHGHDNSSCLKDNSSWPCKTIDFALDNLHKNSTRILIEQPDKNSSYLLKNNHTIVNLIQIELIGKTDTSPIKIECGSEVGLSFHFCEGISMKMLEFSSCGRIQHSAPADNFNRSVEFYAGVFLANCKDFFMENCTVFGSPGKGLVLYDVGGNVNISASTFENNTPLYPSNTKEQLSAGGGLSVLFTQYGALPPFNATKEQQLNYTTKSTYHITNCTFKNNHRANYSDSYCDLAVPFQRGGGMSILFHGIASNNMIMIDNCDFIRNSALWGAGLFLLFLDSSEGNQVYLANSKMESNEAALGGGGVRSGSEIDQRKVLQSNNISYKNLEFVNNSAVFGGAFSHYGPAYTPISEDDHRVIRLKECSFRGNKATLGSALGVSLNNYNEFGIGPQVPYLLQIEDTVFTDNSIIKTEDKVVIGQGALYTTNTPVILKGDNSFTDNSNTAILLDNAALKVYGRTNFSNNRGINGGAIALYGQSRIITTHESYLQFENNTAKKKGGALYVQAPGPGIVAFKTRQLRRHNCFLGYENDAKQEVSINHVEEWKTRLEFLNNNAQLYLGGDAIYATSLQACFRANESRMSNTAFEWKGVVSFTGQTAEEISTDPVYIDINRQEWSVAPSEVFDATVILLDEKGNKVYGTIQIDISTDSQVSLDLPSKLFVVDVDVNTQESKLRNLKLKGIELSEFQIHISSLAGDIIQSVKTQLKKCNPGFKQKAKNSSTCVCANSDGPSKWTEGIYLCNGDGKTLYLKTGYWGGDVNDTFITLPCPPGYCNNHNQYSISSDYYTYDRSTMCGDNRDPGILLCGECKKNYSIIIGDEKCAPESDCNLLWWQILLFIIVIPTLVLIVLKVNINLFTSYLNSWLFFYQVLDILLNKGGKLGPVITVIIKLANLQIPGIGTCLFKCFNNMKKLGLNYLIPGYVLFILLIIMAVSKHRLCRNCYVNRNVFRAFCTLIVLCYTSITTISFHIIYVKQIPSGWVFYMDGKIELTKNCPAYIIVLFTLAILLILTFVFVFPVVLVFRSKFLSFLDPFVDIFQDCYHQNLVFFAAYFFVCRIALILVDVFADEGPFKRSLLEFFTLVFLLVFVYFKPYRSQTVSSPTNYEWLNTVDSLFLTILCFITILCSAQTMDASALTKNGFRWLVIILSWVPMVYLLGLLCYGIYNCNIAQYFRVWEYQEMPQASTTPPQSSGERSSLTKSSTHPQYS